MNDIMKEFAEIAEEWDDMKVYVGDGLEKAEINPMTISPPDDREAVEE